MRVLRGRRARMHAGHGRSASLQGGPAMMREVFLPAPECSLSAMLPCSCWGEHAMLAACWGHAYWRAACTPRCMHARGDMRAERTAVLLRAPCSMHAQHARPRESAPSFSSARRCQRQRARRGGQSRSGQRRVGQSGTQQRPRAGYRACVWCVSAADGESCAHGRARTQRRTLWRAGGGTRTLRTQPVRPLSSP
jgi:hypothetical protein